MPEMSPEERGLLRYICDHPDDDLPRLVYADWLEETGHPARIGRAHFIRLQCDPTARHDPAADSDVTRARRELKLASSRMSPGGTDWRDLLPTFPGIAYSGEYRRGFPRGVSAASLKQFVDAAPELLTTVPVHSVRPWRVEPAEVELFIACPELVRVPELDLAQSQWDSFAVRMLAGSPYLGGVRTLILRGCTVELAAVRLLFAEAKNFHPESIDLSDMPLGPVAAALFAAQPATERLKFLHLRRMELGAAGVDRLARVSGELDLETVDLSRNAIGDAGAAALVGHDPWPRLKLLVLAHNDIGDAGARVLRQWVAGRRGVRLVLRNNPISDDAPAGPRHL